MIKLSNYYEKGLTQYMSLSQVQGTVPIRDARILPYIPFSLSLSPTLYLYIYLSRYLKDRFLESLYIAIFVPLSLTLTLSLSLSLSLPGGPVPGRDAGILIYRSLCPSLSLFHSLSLPLYLSITHSLSFKKNTVFNYIIFLGSF